VINAVNVIKTANVEKEKPWAVIIRKEKIINFMPVKSGCQ